LGKFPMLSLPRHDKLILRQAQDEGFWKIPHAESVEGRSTRPPEQEAAA